MVNIAMGCLIMACAMADGVKHGWVEGPVVLSPVSASLMLNCFGMILSLDKEAKRIGVPRQSLIKVLIAEHLERF